MGMPASGDSKRRHANFEAPLEDAESVLGERVDLSHSLLDEAELGTEEEPAELADRAAAEQRDDEADEAVQVEAVLAPIAASDSDAIDPEELEERIEEEVEAGEVISLHDEESLVESLLDEGVPLEGVEGDLLEDELARRREKETPTMGPSPHRGPAERETARRGERRSDLDFEHFRRLLLLEHHRLEELKDDIDEEGLRDRSEQEDLSALSAVDQHPADQATETFDRERDVSIRDQIEGELLEVQRGLRRLDDGTYGRCEACGKPIDTARLLAEPATRLCVDDQRKLEEELALARREVEL